MATNSIANTTSDVPLAPLSPELHPDVEHLVTEDDAPVDNLFSEKQPRLLTEPLYSSWAGPGEDRPYLAMANVGLFYALRQPPLVPDMLLSLDVSCPENLWPKPHRSYFVWEYGKPPDAIVEIVSNREGGEDSDKLTTYARIHIPYYAIYDPEQALSDRTLRVFRLEGMNYREIEQPIWFPEIGLGLRIWQGSYEGHENTWLRWTNEQGHPIATGTERIEQESKRADKASERAEKERARAEKERERAENERERAEKLAEQLRRHGVDPEA